jgi:regulator of sigma E protease
VREKPLKVLEKSLVKTPDKPVQLTVQRQGREQTITVTPKVREITYTVIYPDKSEKRETEREGDLGVAWKSGATSRIDWVRPQSPADQAGLRSGDQIVAVNGERTQVVDHVQQVIRDHVHQPVQLTIRRRDQERTLTVIPGAWQITEQDSDVREDGTLVLKKPPFGQIGVTFYSVRKHLPLGTAILRGSRESVQWIVIIPQGILKMIQGKAPRQVGGPVSIVRGLDSAASHGLEYFLYLVAVFSINIALFNLFPLPALDGGRLTVLVLEGLRRKPINRRREAMVHLVGLVVLLTLLVVVSIGEIRAWIHGVGPWE